MLAAEEDTLRVHGLHPVPGLDRGLEDRRVVRGGDAGVVVQHVDAAEALLRSRVHRANGVFLGDVHLHREPADLACDLLGRSEVDVGDAHLRALLGEEVGRVGAHPAARAGDHAHLSVEPVHSVE